MASTTAFAGLAAPLPRRAALARRCRRVAPVALLDPGHVAHIDWHAASLVLADAAAAVGDAGGAVVEAAAEAKKGGWWESFVALVESAVVALHDTLVRAGVPGAYGVSIILFTVTIKAITFPLNYKQMESTMRMQALAPRLKKIQTDYKDNPAVLNQMTAQLYKDENINPLAGCLPVFIQIPVWIALYRSLLNLASDDLLKEGFLWLPSLQGPVSKTGQGLNTWLFPLQNGAPPIGWHDALSYLIIPVILVASQSYSQKLLQPPNQDPQSQQANKFLKFMPLLIGWFSLNVPSGLGVYWVTNNLVSTAQTLFIRDRYAKENPESADSSALTMDATVKDVPGSRSLDDVDGFKSNGSPAPKASKGSKGSSKTKPKRRKRK